MPQKQPQKSKHILSQASQWIKKRRLLLFVYLPLSFLAVLTLYVSVIYVQWSHQRETILSRLKDYKRFIDYTENIQDGIKIGGYLAADVQGTAIGIPSKIYDRNGVLIGEFFNQKRQVIPLKKIPKKVIYAVISNEDAEFFEHHGINPQAIVRAFFVNLFYMSYRQGGSTLTQQLAKVLFTEGRKTIKRKIFEAFCAWEIEEHYDKRDILAMYLNLIYFGQRAYGIEEASQTYFNKSAQKLSLGEAAMLAGLIPNPAAFNPIDHIDRSVHRTKLVLNRLIEVGRITPKQKKSALQQLKRRWEIQLLASHPKGGKSLIGSFEEESFRINRAPHFNERIRRQLSQVFSEKTLKQNGLKIYTTLDINKQKVASRQVRKVVQKQRDYHRKRAEKFAAQGRKNHAQKEKQKAEDINGALISLNPRTGQIEAYIAGYEFTSSNQLDHITQIYRQPGSSFKPFVYLAALADKKITIASILKDERININGYSPQNYDNKYRGNVSARDALRKSINTLAVKVLHRTGFDTLFDFLRRGLDLSSDKRRERFPRNLSLALGSGNLSPQEHARLHATIANGGHYIIPYGLKYVEDYGGKIILNREKEIKQKIIRKKEQDQWQIISPQAAHVATAMLQGFFEPGVYGHKWKRRYKYPFPVGGKTGTTSNYVDAWFVGYTPHLVTSLWLGNDAGNITLGPGKTGGRLMAPVWASYTHKIRKYVKKGKFPKPKTGIVYEDFCNVSGKVPRHPRSCKHAVRSQPFLAGTEPGSYCPLHP